MDHCTEGYKKDILESVELDQSWLDVYGDLSQLVFGIKVDDIGAEKVADKNIFGSFALYNGLNDMVTNGGELNQYNVSKIIQDAKEAADQYGRPDDSRKKFSRLANWLLGSSAKPA